MKRELKIIIIFITVLMLGLAGAIQAADRPTREQTLAEIENDLGFVPNLLKEMSKRPAAPLVYTKTEAIMLKQEDGVPVIERLEIAPARQGCPGHPKTIAALVSKMSVERLDLEALQQTTCMRRTSCGMNLADCISAIKAAG